MTRLQPTWRRRGDAPIPFVITVCGGSPETLLRVAALAAAPGPGDWRALRPGCREADFHAVPEAAWEWLVAIREVVDDADVYVQPRAQLPKRLLICDMDMTIVAAETLDEIARALGLGDGVARITNRAMRGEVDFDDALRERIAMLKGHPVRFFDEAAQSLDLSPGASDLVGDAVAAGVHTILISGGFAQIAEVVADRLGFDEVFCNRLEIENGLLTGRVVDPIVNGDLKRRTLLERAAVLEIPLDACCAIGDGANDLPMLRAAGLGIAYRGKPILRDACACRIEHTDLSSALAFMGIGK